MGTRSLAEAVQYDLTVSCIEILEELSEQKLLDRDRRTIFGSFMMHNKVESRWPIRANSIDQLGRSSSETDERRGQIEQLNITTIDWE